ncbi:TraX family protein [Legionella sp. CNM-4043-24]|uniref:TraX family protein n=1 Tax=Legionella sp. CNM-4043-24 TaxID=3421646 RepID=UPI00403AC61D
MHALKPIKISSGTLEALKWLGLLFMTIDHSNRVFYNGSINWAYDVGRLALPLFAFVFSYNYAQVVPFESDFYQKSFSRLLIFGALATPAYILMKHMTGLVPLNILFTLFAIGACVYFYELNRRINLESFAIALVAGVFVEYSWPGIILGLAYWRVCRQPNGVTAVAALLATAFLYLVNRNFWAMAALPIMLLAPWVNLSVPRIRYLFWWYYPLHLSVLVLLYRLIYSP